MPKCVHYETGDGVYEMPYGEQFTLVTRRKEL